MAKAVIFDLYDTVLKDLSFSFNAGMDYLYDSFFKDACIKEEFLLYEETFSPLYEKRKVDNSEVTFIKDEVPLLFEHFQVALPENLDDLEYNIMNHMQENTLLDEVRETLETLDKQNVPMYILSNSIFSGRAAERFLQSFGILEYFEKVMSSADYGIRKPSEKLFQIAVDTAIKNHPELCKEDILFVGNDYRMDAQGASAAGLRTVWYNVKHLANENNIDVIEVDDFREIGKLVDVFGETK